MISFGLELLVIEMMGVIWSNWRMREVADTPSNFGITISYKTSIRNDKTIARRTGAVGEGIT